MAKDSLTVNQEKFVQELIKGKSQREAYRTAYPRSVKWKDNVVDVKASELLKVGKVLVRYNELNDRLRKEAEDECIVEAKDVLRELARIAFTDRTSFAKVVTAPKLIRVWDEEKDQYVYEESKTDYDQFVQIIDTDQLTTKQKSVISGIKSTRYGISVETFDKLRALEMLGKTLSMFKDQIEISGQVNNPMEGLTTEELKKLIYDE